MTLVHTNPLGAGKCGLPGSCFQACLNKKGSEGYEVVHGTQGKKPSQASPSAGSRHRPASGFREVPLSFCGATGLSSLLRVTNSSWCDFLILALIVLWIGSPLSPRQTMVVGDAVIFFSSHGAFSSQPFFPDRIPSSVHGAQSCCSRLGSRSSQLHYIQPPN